MIVFCARCDAKVDAREEGSFTKPFASEEEHENAQELWNLDGDEEPLPDYAYAFRLLSCPICLQPVLIRESAILAGEEVLWPTKPTEGGAPSLAPEVPERVRASFVEAIRCLNSGTFIASAMMCRRTLEALCRHYYPKKERLQLAWALNELSHDKVIDARIFEWAQSLKDSGNLAAHDTEQDFSEEEARDLADFTQVVLEHIFVLGPRFERFRERQRKRQKPAEPKSEPGTA